MDSNTPDIISKLKDNVEAMRKNKSSMGKASFCPFHGIIISGNEAAQLIEIFEAKQVARNAYVDRLYGPKISGPIIWKANTPQLLKEILGNNGVSILRQPIQIFADILGLVAERANKLQDPELNGLMARLALYEISDPYSKEFDAKITNNLVALGHEYKQKEQQ